MHKYIYLDLGLDRLKESYYDIFGCSCRKHFLDNNNPVIIVNKLMHYCYTNSYVKYIDIDSLILIKTYRQALKVLKAIAENRFKGSEVSKVESLYGMYKHPSNYSKLMFSYSYHSSPLIDYQQVGVMLLVNEEEYLTIDDLVYNYIKHHNGNKLSADVTKLFTPYEIAQSAGE